MFALGQKRTFRPSHVRSDRIADHHFARSGGSDQPRPQIYSLAQCSELMGPALGTVSVHSGVAFVGSIYDQWEGQRPPFVWRGQWTFLTRGYLTWNKPVECGPVGTNSTIFPFRRRPLSPCCRPSPGGPRRQARIF